MKALMTCSTAWMTTAILTVGLTGPVDAAGHGGGGGGHGGGGHGGHAGGHGGGHGGAYHSGGIHSGGRGGYYGGGYGNFYGGGFYLNGFGSTYGYSPYGYGAYGYSNLPGVNGPAALAPTNTGTALYPPAVAPAPAIVNGQATIQVIVPTPDAQVSLGSSKTSSTGLQRVYFTGQLEPGYRYSYAVTATWTQDGQTFGEVRNVSVAPNQVSVVDFTRPNNADSK